MTPRRLVEDRAMVSTISSMRSVPRDGATPSSRRTPRERGHPLRRRNLRQRDDEAERSVLPPPQQRVDEEGGLSALAQLRAEVLIRS
jgi:hypothetical protein